MAFGTVNVGQASEDMTKYLTLDQVGVPGGLATLGADGKLTTSQIPEIDHYTQSETDGKIADSVSAHNSNTSAHSDIRTKIAELETNLKALELKDAEVTENPYTVTFASLDGLSVTGVWNADSARIEF